MNNGLNVQMQAETFDTPFRHWIIPDFIEKVDVLLEALKKEPFNRKECDLFQFFQGQDISLSKQTVLQQFFADISNPAFLQKIKTLTGANVTHIDMSPFIYGDTDYLLPHDDRLEGRKIAYVLYLNDVSEQEGGGLALFEDTSIVKTIIPKKGQLVLFEVSEKSVHQVLEVVGSERITFAGWFHGSK